MTLEGSRKEGALSVRLVWPFVRLGGAYSRALERLNKVGISPAAFANPDTRVPHRIAMQLLRDTVLETGNLAIGLHAGDLLEPGDFEVLEYAARSAPTLGDGIDVTARYFRILHDAAEVTLVTQGETAEWRFRVTDGVPQPSAANDFVVAAALTFSRRNAGAEPPLELRFMHDRPSYSGEYARFAVPIKFGAPYNAIVLRTARLATPMLRADPNLLAAFELHARHVIDGLEARDGIVGRVRETIAAQLGMGEVTMRGTARKLAMSVATLRRRLEQEGTTFSSVVEEMRRRLAEQYLAGPRPAVSEIAFLLGFADVASFDRAFKRWTGVSPTKYRSNFPST